MSMKIDLTNPSQPLHATQVNGFGYITWDVVAQMLSSSGFVDKRHEEVVGFEVTHEGVKFLVAQKDEEQ